MSKANTWETGLLNLLFCNAAFTNVGDTGGLLPSATAGNLYLSLHTADPGETGDQTTNEATYTGYQRLAVARSAGAWSVSGNQVSNISDLLFAACSGGSNTITHFGIGTAPSGAGKLLYSGAATPNLIVSSGVTPKCEAGNCVFTED